MSTLGDLLAEHTVLPGNAVDHLHAVVGEWQLLADLSFADYLMWVRRDDGVLVCVAQVRPNTAPTGLLADAVGIRRSRRGHAAGDRRIQVWHYRPGKAVRDNKFHPVSTWRPYRCVTTTKWWRC